MLELRLLARGLRVRFILLYEVSGYVGEYRVLSVRARQGEWPCWVVPSTDSGYHGVRANDELTCRRMILPSPRHQPDGGVWQIADLSCPGTWLRATACPRRWPADAAMAGG